MTKLDRMGKPRDPRCMCCDGAEGTGHGRRCPAYVEGPVVVHRYGPTHVTLCCWKPHDQIPMADVISFNLERVNCKGVAVIEKPKRRRAELVHGDEWMLELECAAPGESYLVVHIGGKQQGRVPIGNVLQTHAKFDDGAADAAQREIVKLRRQAGDWESKYYDKVVDQMRLGKLEGEVATARALQAAAESELAHLRQSVGPRTDPELEARFKVLAKLTQAMIDRCHRCHGSGKVEGFPCVRCATAREVFTSLQPQEMTGAAVATLIIEGDAVDALIQSGTPRHDMPTSSGDVLDRVFLLDDGVGQKFWRLGSDTDPLVKACRRGEIPVDSAMDGGGCPPGWSRGQYLALVGVNHWANVTHLVVVDREAGLAALPEYLRGQYTKMANADEWQ